MGILGHRIGPDGLAWNATRLFASLRVMKDTTVPRNQFGRTDLEVSRVGFGAWAIGGPAMAGDVPIGWGRVDDQTSIRALEEAYARGINFFDTADFYGLGHSEELIGEVLGGRPDVTIATKVGHRLAADGSIYLDYTRDHILAACESSLRRLRRDRIDLYQLHSARLPHLQSGECTEAMEELVARGLVRYWGISLNTFEPAPEAEFLMDRGAGSAFQLVLNPINQRSLGTVLRARSLGYGVIARMPLQFGLLSGKFSASTTFERDDHRHFRLKPSVLRTALMELRPFFEMAARYDVPPHALALSYVLGFPEVSTVIPGIRTPEQSVLNTINLVTISDDDRRALEQLYEDRLADLLEMMRLEEGSS
jgi:aryl-alcohol dehydrogenase-like predicted oxidoreductase